MQTIRSKRSAAAAVAAANASVNSGGNNNGQLAGTSGMGGDKLAKKTRKRGRTPLPGKCHSCNIRETPEWRRGPDGARTLCNACGLHYAKLVRKRDKALMSTAAGPSEVESRPVDMEMVRASTQKAGGQALGSSDSESKVQYMQQVSPPTIQQTQGMVLETTTSAPGISPHDSYHTNTSYPISSYSTLTPQRVIPPSQSHSGIESQVVTWDGDGPNDEHFIRNFRANSRDERR